MTRRFPMTLAIRTLQEASDEYVEHIYDDKETGARAAAEALCVDERVMIKTLVIEDENGKPFMILMYGDKKSLNEETS